MVKCPKCQKELPWTKMVFLGYDGLTCPTCFISLEPENLNLLGFISFVLASLIVLLGAEILKATGYASYWYRFWKYSAILWIALFIQVPLRAFFLRMRIKMPAGKLLNL